MTSSNVEVEVEIIAVEGIIEASTNTHLELVNFLQLLLQCTDWAEVGSVGWSGPVQYHHHHQAACHSPQMKCQLCNVRQNQTQYMAYCMHSAWAD